MLEAKGAAPCDDFYYEMLCAFMKEGGARERDRESDNNTTHSERHRRFQTTQLQMKLDS